MSRFVTQTLDDQLTVAVIAPDGTPLAKEVVQVLEKNQLSAQIIRPDEKQFESLNHDVIYKYILIYQSKKEFGQVLTEAFLSTLQAYQAKLLILGTVETPFEGVVPLFSDWHQQTQNQASAWQKIQKILPKATYCLGQDVFTSEEIPVWIQSATKKVGQGELYSAHLPVFPQKLSYFTTTISKALLSPLRGERVIYSGGETFLHQVVEKINQKYVLFFDKKLEEKKVALNQEPIQIDEYLLGEWTTKTTKKGFSDDLSVIVAEKLPQVEVENKPETQKTHLPKPAQQEEVTLPPKPKKTRLVVPAVTAHPDEEKPTKPEEEKEAEPLDSPDPNSKHSEQEEQIESALQKLFADQQVERKVKRVTKVAKATKTATVKNKRKKSVFYLGLAFVGMSLGLLVLFGGFWLSVFSLERKLLAVSQKLQETHTKTFSEESQQLAFVTSIVEAQMESYQVLLSAQLFSYPDSLVEVSNNLIGLGESLNDTRDLTQLATRQLFGSETGDVLDTLQAASNKANEVYQQLSLLQAAIDGLDQEKLSPDEVQKIADFTQVVQDERKSLAIIQQLQPLMASLLGGEGKRTYAIFLQDNQELRPTGGFLNSVALVTVDQGLVIDTQVHSIYALEKNFGGEITPPEEITLLLEEDKLFFHDANWDPDFEESAEQLSFFLEKTTGQKVSGILAIDLYGLEEIIKAVGPLDLPEYNEVLTDRNIHERSEFHSEITLDDEAGEQSYLPVVMQKLLNQVLVTSEENVGSFLSGVHQAFKQNHLQVYLTESSENTSFKSLGWTGGVLLPDCPVQLSHDNCVVDAFYQVEANIGVNKANHYLKREIHHQITLGQEEAQHTRSIVFENTAPTNAWPRGEYSAYVRFYLPVEATLSEITIDGVAVDQSNMVIQKEDGRTIAGIVVRVPIQTEQEVFVRFTTPLPPSDDYSYAFFDQKQPGTTADNQVITLSREDGQVPTTIAPQALINQSVVTFQYERDKHGFVGVSFE